MSYATVVASLDDLEKTIKDACDKTIIIDFFAEWCGPCKLISPKLREFAKSSPNILLIKVDVDEAGEVADKYDITVLPTFVVLKGGVMTDKLVGSEVDKIERMFKKYDERQMEVPANM